MPLEKEAHVQLTGVGFEVVKRNIMHMVEKVVDSAFAVLDMTLSNQTAQAGAVRLV